MSSFGWFPLRNYPHLHLPPPNLLFLYKGNITQNHCSQTGCKWPNQWSRMRSESQFTSLGEEDWHLDNVCTLQKACWCHFVNTQVSDGNQKCLGQSIQVAWALGPFQRAVPKLRLMRRDVRRSALQLFLGNYGTFFNTQEDRVCPAGVTGCPNHLSLHQHLQP